MKVVMLWSVVLFSAVLPCARPAAANPGMGAAKLSDSAFTTPTGLADAVAFWVLVFTKYGRDQVVFHHREDPGIIYSSLDFFELSQKYGGTQLETLKEKAIEGEIDKIRGALLSLAAGNQPRDVLERRIERLFARNGGHVPPDRYRDAASMEKLRYQTGIKERFRDGVRRSGRMMKAIEAIFAERGLPKEIARLPLVESSFDYTAYSSVGAAGIWQFMPKTGRKYMRIDSYIDERRDPLVSSRAAADYLIHAYEVLGTWPLALTSYNHGIAGVARAVRDVGSSDLGQIVKRYNGSSFGFASKNFYAEFLAALHVEQNWRQYFPGLVLEPPLEVDEVRLGRPVHYRDLLRISGMSEESFQEYNTALLKPVTKGKAGVPAGYLVKVPTGAGQRIVSAVPGSIIYSTARKPKAEPPKGKPAPAAGKKTGKQFPKSVIIRAGKPAASAAKSYTVAPGDNVWSISKKLKVPVNKLKAMNPGVSKQIKPGQKLKVP